MLKTRSISSSEMPPRSCRTAKIGGTEYVLATNASPDTVEALNRIPVLTRNGATTYLSEVAHVRDGFSPLYPPLP